MTPTPETDAEVILCHGIPDGFNPPERSYTSSKFARRLERERDEALSVADTLSGIASAYLGWHLSRTPHGADDRSLEVARNVTAAIKRWKELKR